MNILITRAASGIGRGLAPKLVRPGVSLQLCDHAVDGLMDLLPPRLAERYYMAQRSAQPAGMPDF